MLLGVPETCFQVFLRQLTDKANFLTSIRNKILKTLKFPIWKEMMNA